MKGYIALISVLIISAVLVLIALSASHFGIGRSTMVLQKNQASESYYLAMACAEEALMKFGKDPKGYRGNETLTINGKDCTILPIAREGKDKIIIKVLSNTYNQTKKIKIKIKKNKKESWQEVAEF